MSLQSVAFQCWLRGKFDLEVALWGRSGDLQNVNTINSEYLNQGNLVNSLIRKEWMDWPIGRHHDHRSRHQKAKYGHKLVSVVHG